MIVQVENQHLHPSSLLEVEEMAVAVVVQQAADNNGQR
jgi:hypothetical protein